MNKAEISDGKVVNAILVDPNNIPNWCADWPELTEVATIGWLYQDGQFLPPPTLFTKEEQEAHRKAAYASESDPIFFMAQRGEATIAEWEAKVAEIKAAYPYPNE